MPEVPEHKPQPRGRKHNATIYDIARDLGVSPSTVSRALNKPGRINAQTEKRIRDAASRLGYRSNPMARALPTGRTRMLGLLLSDITNPAYFPLIRGAEHACSEAGYTLVLAESQESGQRERGTLDRLLPAVDGLILVGSRMADADIAQLADDKPIVLVNREVPGLPSVVPDLESGIKQAVDHLVEHGHRTLAYLSGPTGSWIGQARGELILDHAVRSGARFVEIGPNDPTVDGGASALRRVHASGATALLAYNDLMVIGLLKACSTANIPVPSVLSLVGFDDIFGADLTTPTISTIRSPLHEAGSLAVDRLRAEVEDQELSRVPPLATEFIARESTGAASFK